MDDTVFRLLFTGNDDAEVAENILDEIGAWYDYDSGDRMMVHKDGLEALYDANLEFDEI